MNDYFEIDAQDGVAHLVLNRPERMNTFAPAFFPALRDAVQAMSDAGETRALVISSTGRHFSAGMALDVFAGTSLPGAETARARLAFQQTLRRLMACFDALDGARFPILCAVQGGCIGGALDLAAACDLRYASADAFFCVQEINIGMAADLGVLQRLPKIVSPAVAREMAYRLQVDAIRARRSGCRGGSTAKWRRRLASASAGTGARCKVTRPAPGDEHAPA